MQKLLFLMGVCLSTQVFSIDVTTTLRHDHSYSHSHSRHHSNSCCRSEDPSCSLTPIVEGARRLYAFSEGEEIQGLIEFGEDQWFVPFYFNNVLQNIDQDDAITFRLNRGLYEFSFYLSVLEQNTVFALQTTDSTGTNLIPGSRMAFGTQFEGAEFTKSLTLLYFIEEDNTLLRLTNVNNENADLQASEQFGVFSAISIVGLDSHAPF